MSNYIHTRYIAWSDLFFKAIKDLGFVELKEEYIKTPKGRFKLRKFQKDNKFITISYLGILLGIKKGKPEEGNQEYIIKYEGLSVNKDFFEYFVRKGEYPNKKIYYESCSQIMF